MALWICILVFTVLQDSEATPRFMLDKARTLIGPTHPLPNLGRRACGPRPWLPVIEIQYSI